MSTRETHDDWVSRARELFDAPKPEHFTDFEHCCECEEHDRTLCAADVDTISLEELGNPGWDPICFASPEGKKYYLPALVRLSLDSMGDEFYLDQFLFHLEWDGPANEFFESCTAQQRQFVADFLEFVIEEYAEQIERCYCSDSALRAHATWSRRPQGNRTP